MNREQFDKLYAHKAVWCKTFELTQEFLALAYSVGYKWGSGASLKQTFWGLYGVEIVYFPVSNDNKITYARLSLAKNENYDIVEFGSLPRVFDADALAIELSAIHKHLSLIDEPISGLIDVVKVEDLPKVKELRDHYEKMSEIIESLKGE